MPYVKFVDGTVEYPPVNYGNIILVITQLENGN